MSSAAAQRARRGPAAFEARLARGAQRAGAAVAALVVAPLVGGACAARAPQVDGTNAQQLRERAAREAQRARDEAAEPWRAALVPEGHEELQRAAAEGDRPGLYLWGSLRVQVEGERVRFARDASMQPVIAHAHDGDDWYFATRDGVFLRSRGFLGALERAGGTRAQALDAGFVGSGVLTARDARGLLWLAGDGRSATLAPPPVDGPVLDAGFVDRSFGVAVRPPGLLYRSTDGGARFELVPTGVEAVSVVHPNPSGHFVLVTTGGLLRLGPTGAAAPYQGGLGAVDYSLGEDEAQRLRSSFEDSEDYPLALARRLARGGWLTQDGRALWLSRDDAGGVEAVDAPWAASSAGGVPRRLALPHPQCDVRPWGRARVAVCPPGSLYAGLALLRSDAGEPFREWLRSERASHAVVAFDGGAVVLDGACPRESEDAPEESEEAAPARDGAARTRVCWYHGGAFRTRALRGRAVLLDAWGDAVLYRPDASPLFDDVRPSRAVHLARAFECDDASREGGGAPLESDLPGAVVVRARFGALGIVGAAALREHELFAAVGDGAGPLRTRPLPRGAHTVAFADARHGVAAGDSLHELWVTRDGGGEWQRPALPLSGERRLTPLGGLLDGASPRSAEGAAWCMPDACVVGRRVVWAPERVLPAGVTLYAAEGELDERAGGEPLGPRDQGYEAPRFACELPARPGADRPAAHWYGAGAWVDGAAIERAGRGALRWGGADERGPFTARSDALAWPPIEPGATPQGALAAAVANATLVARPGVGVVASDRFTPQVRLATRGLVVLERCAPTPGFALPGCDLLAVPRRGPAVRLGALRDLLAMQHADDPRVRVHAALGLRDGGAVLYLRQGAEGDLDGRSLGGFERADLLLRLDAQGRLVARRGYAWGTLPNTRMLALDAAGAPGLAVASAGDALALRFFSMEPGAATSGAPWLTLPRRLERCDASVSGAEGAAGAREAGVLVASGREYAPTVALQSYQLRGDQWLRATLERRGDERACLRSMEFWSSAPDDPVERDLLAAAGGALRVRTAGAPRATAAAALDARVLDPRGAGALVCRQSSP